MAIQSQNNLITVVILVDKGSIETIYGSIGWKGISNEHTSSCHREHQIGYRNIQLKLEHPTACHVSAFELTCRKILKICRSVT